MKAAALGSFLAGCGGLDIAAEWGFGAQTLWQLDKVGADVRGRHWPDAHQYTVDVKTPAFLELVPTLPAVDILTAGFSCKDVSSAGKGELLGGRHSGPTYRATLAVIRRLRPPLVMLENTPQLLTKLRATIDRDLDELGYGCTWVRARALDAGAPHLRARVFVFARLGTYHRAGVLDASRDGAWVGRIWPTPTEGDAKMSGSRSLASSSANAGTSLTDAVRADRATAERPWATALAADAKDATKNGARGNESLVGQTRQPGGKRLNPDWVETLQGLPVGWTLPTGPSLRDAITPKPAWPRGRYPKGWDRTQPWPGLPGEPPRTYPDDLPPVRGRPARLRFTGNVVVPQQGLLAICTYQEAA